MTKKTLARNLGFKTPKDKHFRQLLKIAEQRKLVKIEQGGFLGDSMHHHKIVVILKVPNLLRLVENSVFPSWLTNTRINGYSLHMERTGKRRQLKTGEYSRHKWWICEDCKREIKIGQPYASRVDFSKHKGNFVPVYCKCFPCFLDMVEEYELFG